MPGFGDARSEHQDIDESIYSRDKCGFWGWLKRLLKIPTQPNPGIPAVLRGYLAQSDGDAVLSTTLPRDTSCGQAREQNHSQALIERLLVSRK
jgi:hypothetical protein